MGGSPVRFTNTQSLKKDEPSAARTATESRVCLQQHEGN